MKRSPIWYLLGIIFIVLGLTPTVKDFFTLGLFSESPVVLFMAIFFLPFIVALGFFGRKQFTRSI